MSKDMENGVNGIDHKDLRRMETTGSITITPEMFERMYLSPQNKVSGDLRRTFGNPTPMGLGGFNVTLMTLSCAFMEWRGANGLGTATLGTLYFMGGLLPIICSVLEWILGNSFPCAFFGVYGGFFLYLGATLTPTYGAIEYYASMDPTMMGGVGSTGWTASTGFLGVAMGIYSVIAMICALRTNICFVIAFGGLVIAFGAFSASLFYAAAADAANQHFYQVMAGGAAFGVSMIGWYILAALMLTTVDFPINLPVGDLSTVIKGASEIQAAKRRQQRE